MGQTAAVLSVIVPYWNRETHLRSSLERYEALYDDIEVIVVNDGDEPPFVEDYPFVKLINLPRKESLKNPCLPWNVGVENAKGEIIVLTHAEITHRKPVFPQMLEELERRGPKGYVLASCWEDQRNRWLCYPGYRGPNADRIPDEGGLNFCAMLYGSFFEEFGGFDEAYRDGAGYEDNDFIWTVKKHGGDITIRPDLVVYHHRTHVNWGKENFARNKALFHNKWRDYWTRS